jgi:hypothetical protein
LSFHNLVSLFLFACFLFPQKLAANLIMPPLQLELQCDQSRYAEGQPMQFTLIITNQSTQDDYPIVLPAEGPGAAGVFFFNMYDKAKNTRILRYAEACPSLDSGKTNLLWLKPQQQIRIPLTLQAETTTPTHQAHHFEQPVFAGEYLFSVRYQPKGRQHDSLYWFFDSHSKIKPAGHFMPSDGLNSQTCSTSVFRTADTLVSIDGKPYFIKTDGHRFFYFSEWMPTITTDIRCVHITNLPPFASALASEEYYYSHFSDFAEYIRRFDDGDVQEYRKFSDYCPSYLHTQAFDEQKRPTLLAYQMPDARFYRAEYQQPGNLLIRESICSPTGTSCRETTFRYDEQGNLLDSKSSNTQPCVEVYVDGKLRGLTLGFFE